MAPDGTKLSKRKHGPVVSVTTYRDAGFLPQAFINFLCLLGWSPKNDREQMSRDGTRRAFTLEGINRANAVVNFTEEDPFDPKALWLNAEHIRALPSTISPRAAAFRGRGKSPDTHAKITPLIRERIEAYARRATVADFFFVDQLPPYDPAELIPKKGDAAMAKTSSKSARRPGHRRIHPRRTRSALRAASVELGIKAGQMFEPVRVAVCGRKTAPRSSAPWKSWAAKPPWRASHRPSKSYRKI